MMNPQQFSDLTVSIFSCLHVTTDYHFVNDAPKDTDGALSELLSTKLGQTWLIHNSIHDVCYDRFHHDYIQSSRAIENCFLSVIGIDADQACAGERDAEFLVSSILNINRVFKRRVIFYGLRASSMSSGGLHYTKLLSQLPNFPSNSLAQVRWLDKKMPFDDFATLICNDVRAL